MATSVLARTTRFFTTVSGLNIGGSRDTAYRVATSIKITRTEERIEKVAKQKIPFTEFQETHVGSFSKYKKEMAPLFPGVTDDELRHMFDVYSRSAYKRYINSNTSNPALIT